MDKKLIEEQTSLALFEGAIKEDHCHYMIPALNRIVWVQKMLYSSDYNWIMRIVEKIESLEEDYEQVYDFNIYKKYCVITMYDPKNNRTIVNNVSQISYYNKIDLIYKACVEFVQWYNLNLEQNGSN